MSCHLSINLMELVVALTTQLDFCHNYQKKLKLPLDFCHNCQKNENSLGSKYLPLGRKCSTSVTTLTSEKLISTPDREKTIFFLLLFSKLNYKIQIFEGNLTYINPVIMLLGN
jgi:hypothetical protein